MGIETGAFTRPSPKVRDDITALALDVFSAAQRATFALEAAESYNFLYPSRVAAMAVACAKRDRDALVEAHALVKALIPFRDGLVELLPATFGSPASPPVAEAPPAPSAAAPVLAVIPGGRA
jgi:hypothetical protein